MIWTCQRQQKESLPRKLNSAVVVEINLDLLWTSCINKYSSIFIFIRHSISGGCFTALEESDLLLCFPIRELSGLFQRPVTFQYVSYVGFCDNTVVGFLLQQPVVSENQVHFSALFAVPQCLLFSPWLPTPTPELWWSLTFFKYTANVSKQLIYFFYAVLGMSR